MNLRRADLSATGRNYKTFIQKFFFKISVWKSKFVFASSTISQKPWDLDMQGEGEEEAQSWLRALQSIMDTDTA